MSSIAAFQPAGVRARPCADSEPQFEYERFYLIARGSAMESAAALDVLLSRGLIAPAVHRHGRGQLLRVTQMLTKLVQRMQR